MAVVFVVYLTICKNGYVSAVKSFENDKSDLDANSYGLDYSEITSTADNYGGTNEKVESFEDKNGVNGAGI